MAICQFSQIPTDQTVHTDIQETPSTSTEQLSDNSRSRKKLFLGFSLALFVIVGILSFRAKIISFKVSLGELHSFRGKSRTDIEEDNSAKNKKTQPDPQITYLIKTEKRLLFEIPPEHKAASIYSLIVDSDFKHFAYIAKNDYGTSNVSNDKKVLVLDGKIVTDEYDQIEQLRFAPDEKSLSFIALNHVGGRYSKTPEGEYEREGRLERDSYSLIMISLETYEQTTREKIDWYQYSHDGRGLAYKTIDANMTSEYLVVNGKEDRQYYTYHDPSFVFSPDSRNYMYSGLKFSEDYNSWWNYVVVNGKIYEPFNSLGEKVIDNSGEFYFVAQDEESLKWYIHTNNKQHGPFNTPKLIYDFKTKEVINLKEECQVSDYRDETTIKLSDDKRQCAFVDQYSLYSSGQERIVRNGVSLKPYDAVYDPVFSPDGERFGYRAKMNGKIHLVVDDVLSPPYDAAQAPIFCKDNNHVGYIAFRDKNKGKRKAFYVINNEEQLQFDSVIGGRFNKNCSGFTYVAREENTVFIVESSILAD